MRLERIARALSIAWVVLAVACSSNDGTGTDIGGSASGTYALQSVNGSLPATLSAFGGTGGTDVISAGVFTLNANGTWTLTLNASSSGRGAVPTRDCCYTGTWIQSGNSIALVATPTNTWTGSSALINGSALNYTERGFVFVFRKS